MHLTDRQSHHRSPSTGDGAARMQPILARALETGRGPGGLTRWLAARDARPAAVPVLAGELDRLVRRAGVAETLAE